MMKKTAPLCVLLGLLGASSLLAQQPEDTPVPKQPLLSRAPDGSWTIAYKYKTPPATPAPQGGSAAPPHADRVTGIKVEKKGTTYHVITNMQSGLVWENWVVGGMQFVKSSRGTSYVRVTPQDLYYVDFSKTDFDILSWVDMDNYVGVKADKGETKFFVFETKNATRRTTSRDLSVDGDLSIMVAKLNGMSGKGTDEASVKASVAQLRAKRYGDSISRAMIDVATQLPSEYDDGEINYTYTFSTSDSPSAPMDILQMIQAVRDRQRRTYVRASPP